MAAQLPTRTGYIVLADISGYTKFLTGTELEHSQQIIHELTTLIRSRLSPPLRFVKTEGDAVFCYAESDGLGGERLIELIEVCYFDFCNLLFNMVRSTTCQCSACASIGSLDLKFIAHFGTFVLQRDRSADDLVGPDVILAHRLLKNTITEQSGVAAYAFFTQACLQQMPLEFKLPSHTEHYESFGEVTGGVYDLAPALHEMREAHREYVATADADFEWTITVPRTPPSVWQYLVDPVQRLRWACVMSNKDPDEVEANAQGRTGIGTKVHCNHGPADAYREVIDWRPFNYFTTRGRAYWKLHMLPSQPMLETYELAPAGEDETALTWRVRYVHRGLVPRLNLALLRTLFRGGIRHGGERLRAAIQADLQAWSQ